MFEQKCLRFIKTKSSINILLIFLLLQNMLIAQDGGDTSGIRMNWFLKDRAYPYDSMSTTSMNDAIQDINELVQSHGFYFNSSTQWLSIGPTPECEYPTGNCLTSSQTGRIQSVKFMPYDINNPEQHDPNVLFIAGHSGGIWKTTNLQQGWQNVIFSPWTDDLPTQSAGAIAIDPTNPQIIYYASGGSVQAFRYNYYGIGIFKSTNGGYNWTGPYRTGLPGLIYSFSVAVSPNHDVYLALGIDNTGGLFKSTDGGITWAHAPNITHGLTCNDVAISNNGQSIFAIGEDPSRGGIGYWLSFDGGYSFVEYTVGSGLSIPQYKRGRSQISISKADNNYLYVASVSHTLGGTPVCVYSYVSTDGGFTFSNPIYIDQAYGQMSTDFLSIRANPNNSQIALIGYGSSLPAELFATTDGGNSYQYPICNMFPAADINSIDINPNPNYPNQVVVGCDQGLYKVDNMLEPATLWRSINRSFSLTQAYRVATDLNPTSNIVLAKTDGGIVKKRNDLTNYWYGAGGGCDVTNVVASMYKPGIMVASRGPDGRCGNFGNDVTNLYFSANGGANWENSDYPPGGYWDGDEDWIAILTEFPDPNLPAAKFFHARRHGTSIENRKKIDIYVTANGGINWLVNPSNISQIITNDENASPQTITFCRNNPEIIYVSTKNWFNNSQYASRLWKSTNGGQTWGVNGEELPIHSNGIPNRVITSVCTDPEPGYENIVYLTLSGFNINTPGHPGHVFESTNGGENWVDISSDPYASWHLPDIPVNYMIVRRISSSEKELIIATDAGVYHVVEGGTPGYIRWQPIAEGLPNSIAMGLDYSESSQKLKVATFGRGIYELGLQGPVYVSSFMVLDGGGETIDIANDIIVGSGSVLKIPNSGIINMPAGKKITVIDGGQIDASSGASITLTSQSGPWGGIEFQGSTSTATLKNITFSNTNTPITITGGMYALYQKIGIENCTFNDCPVSIDSRGNVEIKNCTFNYSGSYDPLVQAVSSVGSNNITIQSNTVNSNTSLTGTAISVVYGSSVYIVDNTIYDAYNGISISNSSPYISGNILSHSSPVYSNDGIGIDNCNSPSFMTNSVSSYTSGIKLGNSSPVMLSNSSVNSSAVYSMVAESQSFPRMAPLQGQGELVYDAGYNILSTGNNDLYVNKSIPVTDLGCNNFSAGTNGYFIEGEMDILSYPPSYNTTHNEWNFTPSQLNFNIDNGNVTVVFDPTGCVPPGGGGELDPNANRAIVSESNENEPPLPIIVDRGNGFYDTVLVKSTSISSSQDKILFAQGTKEELLGHYQNAVIIFQQLIQSYPHTQPSMKALGSLLLCYERNQADSGSYAALRNSYRSIIQANITDTLLIKIVRNLAAKTLVKMKAYPPAITEYEYIIAHSNDSLETLFAELNIIETYMLIHQGGDAPSFTGKLTYLKPSNIQDGLRMIREKYHSANKKTNVKVVPKEFKLAQNYPNPFNPVTTIGYSLPQNTKVVIKVYDILGRLVKELVNDFKQAGVYEIKFDGTNLASGVYFYKIEADRFVDTKKMVLVK